MTDPASVSPPGDPGMDPDHRSAEGMPRWVKICGLIVLVVLVLALTMLVVGGPDGHGPGRHGLAAGTSALVPVQGHP